MATYQKPLSLYGALNLLRLPGARLICCHKSIGETAYYVVPGGPVDPAVAESLKAHPQIKGEPDGLWPGHSQTWRLGV
jgi:hypothetical protein